MRILFVDNDQTGCYWIRSFLPAKHLRKLGHKCEIKSGEVEFAPKDWDIVVFNRAVECSDQYLREAIALIKHCGTKIIFDTDDALDIVPTFNPAYQRGGRLTKYFYLLNNADLVTTTTPHLAEHLGRWAGNVEVIPNHMDLSQWKAPWTWPAKNRKLRVGFAGSNSHVRDLLICLDAVKELQESYDFEFHVFGLSQDNLDEWMAKFREKIEKTNQVEFCYILIQVYDKLKEMKNVTIHKAVPIKQYAKRLCELKFDIGIAPLEENDFNACKSCLKFYEYALSGAAVLTSRVLPYADENPYTTKNRHKDWLKRLEKLIVDEQFRNELKTEQLIWVKENRDISDEIKTREEIYKSIL